MKGNNKLILSGAAVCEAVQEYLDARAISHADEVITVSYNVNDFTFSFCLQEKKKEPGK